MYKYTIFFVGFKNNYPPKRSNNTSFPNAASLRRISYNGNKLGKVESRVGSQNQKYGRKNFVVVDDDNDDAKKESGGDWRILK